MISSRFRAGSTYVLIVSADNTSILQALMLQDIMLSDVKQVDELQFTAFISEMDLNKTTAIVKRNGGTLKILRPGGVYSLIRKVLQRPVLATGLLAILLLSVVVPGRVFFVRVEGNVRIPAQVIMEKAQESGITFGASRRAVRSEKMKNALISQIPQLQWVGINTSGCVATISVREKSIIDIPEQENRSVASIVAARDGVIESTVVHKGSLLCTVGQAVREGQVLVSGYTDCGNYVQAAEADAEIYGKTNRTLQLLVPFPNAKHSELLRQEVRYSLLFGKKLINFYDSSGISDVSCVKMYEENYWSLPGGFTLPVAIVKETWIRYDDSHVDVPENENPSWIHAQAQDYICSQMIAGKIHNAEEQLQERDDCYNFTARYACTEMIGKSKAEEALPNNGEDK